VTTAPASASASGPGASASDIRFCDQCAESIPASDFEAGRAITADGRHYHQGCAIARSLTISGPRSWFSLGLALYAAGVATFLLVASLGGRTDPETIPAPVEARISEVTTAALDAAGREHASRLLEVAEEEGRLRKADVEAYREEVQGALGVIASRLDEYERFVVANNQALQAMVLRNQQELGQVKRALTDVARRAREEATRRAAPPPSETPRRRCLLRRSRSRSRQSLRLWPARMGAADPARTGIPGTMPTWTAGSRASRIRTRTSVSRRRSSSAV
jgi:hypothetical protein